MAALELSLLRIANVIQHFMATKCLQLFLSTISKIQYICLPVLICWMTTVLDHHLWLDQILVHRASTQ